MVETWKNLFVCSSRSRPSSLFYTLNLSKVDISSLRFRDNSYYLILCSSFFFFIISLSSEVWEAALYIFITRIILTSLTILIARVATLDALVWAASEVKS